MSENVKDAPRFRIRFHGKGRQGAVTGAQLCSMAFDGPATCMPTFGAERMGSPVLSFVKMSKNYEKVRTNEQVYSPQYVAVLDDSLLFDVDCTAGIVPGGYLVINTCRPIEEIKEIIGKYNPPAIHIALIDATNVALEYLGRNITNTLILGALLKICPKFLHSTSVSDALLINSARKLHKKTWTQLKWFQAQLKVYTDNKAPDLSYTKNYKTKWSHVKLDNIGVKEWDPAGVWYVDQVDGGSLMCQYWCVGGFSRPIPLRILYSMRQLCFYCS